jgi:hypothetical protein
VVIFEVQGVSIDSFAPNEPVKISTDPDHFYSPAGNGLDHHLYAHLDIDGNPDTQYATGYLGDRRPSDPTSSQFESNNLRLDPHGEYLNGCYFLLADGHVRYLVGSQVSAGFDARNSKDKQGASYDGQSACGTDSVLPLVTSANETYREDPGFMATFSTK